MSLLNQTRQAYNKFINKASEGEISDAIQAAEDLKSLREHNGWKRLEAFMQEQSKQADDMLSAELGSIKLISFPRLFNYFLKFLYVVQERRAYRKIDAFVKIRIERGEKYAARRAKAEEAKRKQSE